MRERLDAADGILATGTDPRLGRSRVHHEYKASAKMTSVLRGAMLFIVQPIGFGAFEPRRVCGLRFE